MAKDWVEGLVTGVVGGIFEGSGEGSPSPFQPSGSPSTSNQNMMPWAIGGSAAILLIVALVILTR